MSMCKYMKLRSYILCVHCLLQNCQKYYIGEAFCCVIGFGKLIDKFNVSLYSMMTNVPTKIIVKHVTIWTFITLNEIDITVTK
jgi:hypothetical protein